MSEPSSDRPSPSPSAAQPAGADGRGSHEPVEPGREHRAAADTAPVTGAARNEPAGDGTGPESGRTSRADRDRAGSGDAGPGDAGADDADSEEDADGKPAKKQRPLSHELPVLLVVAIALALLLKAFIVQAFYIPSGSMERTLLIKDRVLVNKVVYRFRDVHRGEIVVFNGAGTGFNESESVIPPPRNGVQRALRSVQRFFGVGAPGERDFVKRVIGVGGDTVACCDAQGRVTVNGVGLDEPYVFENNPLESRTFAPVKVPQGELWVMGDHRGDSGDSRYKGPIPQDHVIGRAFVRVWPVSRFGFLRVPPTFAADHAVGALGLGVGAFALAPVLGPATAPVLRTGRRSRRNRCRRP